MASTTAATAPSATTISIFTFGTRSTVYSAPRYCSLWPFWRPNPRVSLTVRPWMPTCIRADFTSSNRWGLMMASIFFTRISLFLQSGKNGTRSFGNRALRRLVHDDSAVPHAAHLGHVEAFDFDIGRHAVAHDRVDDLVDDDRDDAHVGDAGQRADHLGPELS